MTILADHPWDCFTLLLLQVDRKRVIDSLAPADHGSVEYDEFGKDFYTEAPAIAAMTDDDVSTVTLEQFLAVHTFTVMPTFLYMANTPLFVSSALL